MATSFPTSKDNFVNPQGTDSPKLVSHSAQHANANDAIEALETKVGIDGSTDPQSLEYRITNYEPARISFTPPENGKIGQLWFDNQTAEFYVFDGTYWVQVATPIGADGPQGPAGQGVPTGGTSGQYLTKINGTNYNTQWATLDLSSYATNASPTFTGTVNSGPLVVTQASNNANYPIAISSANQQGGGAGYSDLIKLTNSKSGATNINKHLRLKDDGNLEIVNSAYNAAIFVLGDNGALTVSGPINQNNYNVGDVIRTTVWSAGDMGFTSTYSNGSNTYATVASKTYTPASASSYIFVEVYARYYVNGAAEDSFFSQLTWNGNEFAAQRQYWANGSGGGTRSSTLFPLAGRITNGSLTGYTLAINARRDSADDTLQVFADGAFNVKITEVAR